MYLSPDEMSNSTNRIYNEFVLSRDSVKPSCVIIYENATPENIKAAAKAAADWGIPIVKIDRTTIAKNQMDQINNLINDFNETHDYSSLEEAIQLFESNTSGFQLNKQDSTGHLEQFDMIDNSQFNEIFNPDEITKTLNNLMNNPTEEDRAALLSILQKVSDQYTTTSTNVGPNVPKTQSLLEIQKYIDILNGGN